MEGGAVAHVVINGTRCAHENTTDAKGCDLHIQMRASAFARRRMRITMRITLAAR